MRVGQDMGEWFSKLMGMKQGNPIPLTIFVAYLERIIDTDEEQRLDPVLKEI